MAQKSLKRRVENMVNCCFDTFDAGFMREKFSSDWFDAWYFEGNLDGEDAEYFDDESLEGTFGMTHEPMWNTWFVPSDAYMYRWIENHRREVADMGFTLISDSDDGALFAIGVDGAGYSFCDAHFKPLYEALSW